MNRPDRVKPYTLRVGRWKAIDVPARHIGISSKVCDGTADVPRRFGDNEARLLRDGVTPLGLTDAIGISVISERSQPGLRATAVQSWGRSYCACTDAMRLTDVSARS